MRKFFALFILITACLLVACSVSFNDPESENPQDKDSIEVENPEKKEGKEEGEDEDKSENAEEKIVFDPEPVFIKMGEASKSINHVLMNSDNKTTTTGDGDHFILTYIGSDEMYKEVVYSGLMEADKVTASSMGNSKESDVRGTIKMTVSKDTYNIVALEAITDVTTYGSVETNVVNDSLSTFSSFNEIDEITVPKEVVDDAMLLNPGL